ncbi:phosphatidylglycerophosphatase A [Desulfovibrio ferrophilus]|uniref:Phosphatidylglycerophosphatase A n=1 Tax=Desulfovibrio ferrophilus TaxID=241368 RepID=A0A2Z6AYJ4_9BACT|nr:phosphatidylglycerophosphatase A [Desulfovibrio ferrophilus]BBD08332.1 phosphatidylglycerophosphatase A [Desulfovibrio ferrophilus]
MSNVSTSDRIATAFATLGPIGHLPAGPGTWGSAAALITAPFLFMPFSPVTRSIILIALFVLGSLAATRAEVVLGKKDPGCVIIDEVLGQWLTLLPFSILPTWQILAGFIFFRLFDIAKPFPIRRSEKWLPAGWGVMIDDVVAGLYAAAALYGARWAFVNWVAVHANGM